MYSADIDKMPRSELFEWDQFSWLEQVSGFLDHCVLASQHFRDISQSVSTVICNPPLARLLSACECQPRVKLRQSYNVSNHKRYSAISRLFFYQVLLRSIKPKKRLNFLTVDHQNPSFLHGLRYLHT